jgi:hypothetical protein
MKFTNRTEKSFVVAPFEKNLLPAGKELDLLLPRQADHSDDRLAFFVALNPCCVLRVGPRQVFPFSDVR